MLNKETKLTSINFEKKDLERKTQISHEKHLVHEDSKDGINNKILKSSIKEIDLNHDISDKKTINKNDDSQDYGRGNENEDDNRENYPVKRGNYVHDNR